MRLEAKFLLVHLLEPLVGLIAVLALLRVAINPTIWAGCAMVLTSAKSAATPPMICDLNTTARIQVLAFDRLLQVIFSRRTLLLITNA